MNLTLFHATTPLDANFFQKLLAADQHETPAFSSSSSLKKMWAENYEKTQKNIPDCEFYKPEQQFQGKGFVESNDFVFFMIREQKRLFVPAVVTRLFKEKAAEANPPLNKKERRRLKDELRDKVIGRAESITIMYHCAFNLKTQIFFIPATPKKAEGILSHMRLAVGSLPVSPLRTKTDIRETLTAWVLKEESFLNRNCKIQLLEEQITFKNSKFDHALRVLEQNTNAEVISLACKHEDYHYTVNTEKSDGIALTGLTLPAHDQTTFIFVNDLLNNHLLPNFGGIEIKA